MKKKLVFLGLICLSLFAFVGCGTEKLDISNCIDVRYGEFNGSAKIYESSLDLGKLQDIPKLKGLTPDMLKGDYKITLVGDTFSESGIKWFLPFYNKDIKMPLGILRYRTGGLKEYVILGISIVILMLEIQKFHLINLFSI